MFRFVKQILVLAMMFFSHSVLNANSLKWVSINNQDCKIKSEIINVISSNEPLFYPYSVKINKCSRSCNNTNDPYAKMWVPDIVKSINLKVFSLMLRITETKCKCL